MVRPTEPGKGWSTTALELRKDVVDFDPGTTESRAVLRLVAGGRAL
jgi:hypothetical protein